MIWGQKIWRKVLLTSMITFCLLCRVTDRKISLAKTGNSTFTLLSFFPDVTWKAENILHRATSTVSTLICILWRLLISAKSFAITFLLSLVLFLPQLSGRKVKKRENNSFLYYDICVCKQGQSLLHWIQRFWRFSQLIFKARVTTAAPTSLDTLSNVRVKVLWKVLCYSKGMQPVLLNHPGTQQALLKAI